MASPGKPRGRLLRKYVVFFVSLVGGALLTSGLIEIYFSYQENKMALVRLQQEKALAAASKIEQFIKEIESQMGWTTQSPWDASPEALYQHQLDYLRLLRQVPAITEVSQLDPSGREQLRVSRLAINVVGSQADFSRAPKFLEARSGKTYFGPVYFRRESAEPYMTIAMAGSGEPAAVSAAEVNLEFIWEVISQIKIGKAGHAYVVDSVGQLIAHPDISMVLRKTSLASSPQVQAARKGLLKAGAERATIAPDLQGRQVLTAYAAIVPLGWLVFVEQPLEEVFAPLYSSIFRTAVLLVVGLALSILVSLVLARRMVTPIRALQGGAARIGAGDLSHRIEVRSGDELEALAGEFNRMSAKLDESYAGLEQKVEARTRELREALEQQTAIAEVLRAITRSPAELQPVLDAVAENAARLCDATDAHIFRTDGDVLRLAASFGQQPIIGAQEEIPINRDSAIGRAVVDRQTVHVHDLAAEVETQFPGSKGYQARFGTRTMVATPLLREGTPVGGILIRRLEVRPFSEKQIALLMTLADEAAIAIESVRLVQELQVRTRELARSVEELKALGEVSQAVSSTLNLETVLTTIVARAVQLLGVNGGGIYEYDEAAQRFLLRATHGIEEGLNEVLRANPPRLGEGAVGRAAAAREPIQIPDIEGGAYEPWLRNLLARYGYRSVLAVPLLREERIVGGLVVSRRESGRFSPEVVNFLQTFATQSVLAIQNARLFREIEEKGRQLEIANRHKSAFLANVSHELRTPLNAIIGFTRLVLRKTAGQIPALQTENLRKVLISAEHLLYLINGLLDLSKIEAGRMEVFVESFRLDEVIDSAASTVEPMLKDGRVQLIREIAPDIAALSTDRKKVEQVLLNLLSNAVKFTEEGEIKIAAWQENESVKLVVSDTGIGMKKEVLKYIFDEFRQVDMSTTRRYGGTGLGLAIVRNFVMLLRGEIEVESEVGRGSTFTITLPMQLEA